VRAYVKNHGLGLEVPYRYGSETRKYLPDFIVLVDDGHGPDDLLHLVVEIKGYRREDAVEKKSTMDTYWVPGVNHLGTYGRWAFAEFTEMYQMEAEFKAKVESEFNKIDRRDCPPMKTELVQALTTTFEAYAQQTESGIEFWLARDLQHLLGYTKWDNFLNVVSKGQDRLRGHWTCGARSFCRRRQNDRHAEGGGEGSPRHHAYTLRLLPHCPERRPTKAGNRLCPDLFRLSRPARLN